MTQTQNRPAGNPAKRIGRRLLTGLGILLACNALFLAFMTLAFAAASQERVRGHVEMSLSTFRNDLESSPLIDETKAYMPDWRYDMIWVDIAANEPDGALRSAMLLPYLQSEEEQAWENANEGSFYTLLVPLLYYPDEEDVTEYT